MNIYHVTSISETTGEEVLNAVVAAQNITEVGIILEVEGLVGGDDSGNTREKIVLIGFGVEGLESRVIVHDLGPIEIDEDDFEDE